MTKLCGSLATPHWAAGCALTALLMRAAGAPIFALDYQVHGYAAQGYVSSSGNNVFGDSTKGSLSYYEAGINTQLQLRSNLLFAAQGAIRDAGITDTGRPRLDYALMDYRFVSGANTSTGVRLGKVKNPLGFFNETRDVVFTRPSILLPSGYGENQNQRDLVFAAPGVQLYGNVVRGNHEWSLVGTASDDRNVSEAEKRLLITLSVPFSLMVDRSWNAQIMDSIDGGRWQFGFSHFYGRFVLAAVVPATPPLSLNAKIDVGLDVFSARYNGQKFSLTTEYTLNPNKTYLTLGGAVLQDFKIVADTAYLQADYRINSHWNAMTRFDMAFRDRNDRSGREYLAANPTARRASRYSHDLTVGLNWCPTQHWGAWGEYHWVDGTTTVQPLENSGRILADRWSMLMLMAGYTF